MRTRSTTANLTEETQATAGCPSSNTRLPWARLTACVPFWRQAPRQSNSPAFGAGRHCTQPAGTGTPQRSKSCSSTFPRRRRAYGSILPPKGATSSNGKIRVTMADATTRRTGPARPSTSRCLAPSLARGGRVATVQPSPQTWPGRALSSRRPSSQRKTSAAAWRSCRSSWAGGPQCIQNLLPH